jgi:hypothetical protein
LKLVYDALSESELLDLDEKEQNYIVMEKKLLVVNAYKTRTAYGKFERHLPDDLMSVLATNCNEKRRKYLFQLHNDIPFSKPHFGGTVIHIFSKLFDGKHVGCCTLRHSFVSSIDFNSTPSWMIEKTAYNMCHSVQTHLRYRRILTPTTIYPIDQARELMLEQARRQRLIAAATASTTPANNATFTFAAANVDDANAEFLNAAAAAAVVFSEPEMATTLLDAQAETSVDLDLIQSHVEPMDLTHDESMEFDGMDFQDDFYGMSVSTVEPRSKLDAGFLESAPPFRSVLDPPPGIFVDASGEITEIPVSDYNIGATEAGGNMDGAYSEAKPRLERFPPTAFPSSL